MKDIVHFAHGNGFPALCYKQLLTGLEERYQCLYIDKLGHDVKFPVTENWHFLVDELIASIERQSSQPVIGIGHSFGGIVSLVAAIEKPHLFKAVILIDSPLLGRFKSSIVRLAKALGVIDRITPAQRTRARRDYWQNKTELLSYLKTRELFKTFTNECLQDYIDHGLTKTSDGYVLNFNRHIEYTIYRTIPHSLYEYEGRLKIPAALIYGKSSSVVNKSDVRYMKKHYNILSYGLEGSHMLPMEDPKKVVQTIFSFLDF